MSYSVIWNMLRIYQFVLFFLAFFGVAVGLGKQDGGEEDETTTASPSPTMVWVTTTVGGITTVVQATYTQTFAPVPTEAPEVSLGKVGMGSLSGAVGTTRTYDTTTVSGGAAVAGVIGAGFVACGALFL